MKRTDFWITRLQPFPFIMMAFGHIYSPNPKLYAFYKQSSKTDSNSNFSHLKKITASPPIMRRIPNRRNNVMTAVYNRSLSLAPFLHSSLLVPPFPTQFLPSFAYSIFPSYIHRKHVRKEAYLNHLWQQIFECKQTPIQRRADCTKWTPCKVTYCKHKQLCQLLTPNHSKFSRDLPRRVSAASVGTFKAHQTFQKKS